jgi:hypothetical protein
MSQAGDTVLLGRGMAATGCFNGVIFVVAFHPIHDLSFIAIRSHSGPFGFQLSGA